MATVASLFGSQAEATEALDALADSEFEEVETRVYQGDLSDEVGEVQPTGVPSGSTPVTEASPQAAMDSRLTDLNNEELSDFFVEAVEQGQGVLVVAHVDDERAGGLAAFFEEHGGRTAADD
jgi:hypothetical protein